MKENICLTNDDAMRASLGERGVVYDMVEDKPQAMLHLWANGAKQQYPVVDGIISQQEVLTDTMRAWLAIGWTFVTEKA